MDFGDETLAAAADLEETLRVSRRLDEGFNENRAEAIEQRREISAKLARLSLSAHAIPDMSVRSQFLSHLSKMRPALALHQAAWPISAIDQNNPQYRQSIQTARGAYLAFFKWIRLQRSSS